MVSAYTKILSPASVTLLFRQEKLTCLLYLISRGPNTSKFLKPGYHIFYLIAMHVFVSWSLVQELFCGYLSKLFSNIMLPPTHPRSYLLPIEASASRPNQVPYVKHTPQLLESVENRSTQIYRNIIIITTHPSHDPSEFWMPRQYRKPLFKHMLSVSNEVCVHIDEYTSIHTAIEFGDLAVRRGSDRQI